MALIMTCVILLTFTACFKSYATLEEWYADHPSQQISPMKFSANGVSASVELSIEENVVVYKAFMSQKTIGEDPQTDSTYKSYFDSSFTNQQTTFHKMISQLSSESGIDASMISIRYEIYNPGESTPCYSFVYPN